MNIPDNLPEKQERSLLFVRTAIQSRNLQVLSYSYELGTGSILLIFGTNQQRLGKVVIKEDGTRIWQGTNEI
jgi:hypothetical protein